MSTCPSPETIGQFANDKLAGPRYAVMEAHVETCAACQQRLEQLAAEWSACEFHRPERPQPLEQPPTIPGFVIEHELGRGGMGVVYQAWQPHLDRRVAIKIVNASALIGSEDRRRWLREARAIGRVRHRNIVQLYEAGEQDGCLYLVLDLITGGSLAERLTGPLPERVAVELMVAVAKAVEQIHRAGMAHLDIKPSNILLDGPAEGPWDQVTPMLADFGIAREGDDPGATATELIGVRGTPSFMAPEQVTGDRSEIGPRSDVYALGATLYCLLTGRPPFQAASLIETIDLLRNRDPATPRSLMPGLPRDLETITLTCLRKDARRRYASAEALADDLNRWLDGFPIQARPVSKLEHAGRWCRRRPTIASLLAVLALTIVLSVVGLIGLWRHAETERSRAEDALARAIESESATTGAVRDLVGLLTTTVEAPQMLMYERLVEASRVVRELTAKLRQDRAVAAASLVAICVLEHELGKDFARRAKYSESRGLLTDAIELLEARRGGALDLDVELEYAGSLMDLGVTARLQERDDEALIWFQRAEAALADLAAGPENLRVILQIDEVRGMMSKLFAYRGEEESRRRLLESHIRMLDQLNERAGSDPAVGLLAVLVRAELVRDKNASAKIRAAMVRMPADRQLPKRLEEILAHWIAREVEPYPSEPKSSGKPRERVDPAAHARAVIMALDSKSKAMGVPPALFPATATHVCGIALGRGAEQRKAGRLDDARWTAASLLAFGKELSRRDPNEAAFHVVLCEAFHQEAKNASKVGKIAIVERATRDALVEAWTAIRLDPRNDGARIKVAGLQDKMVSLTVRRSSSRSSPTSE